METAHIKHRNCPHEICARFYVVKFRVQGLCLGESPKHPLLEGVGPSMRHSGCDRCVHTPRWRALNMPRAQSVVDADVAKACEARQFGVAGWHNTVRT